MHTRPLAIRMRYMCIYACAILLIGGRAGPFYRFTDSWSLTSLLRVGHRVATLLDSTRESILALRYNFWRLQGTQSCRGKPVLICILALSLVFTPYLSNAVVSAKSPHFFHALVALKLLISLISRLVACSARIVVDKQTERQTDTQTNYCNPRCACAPRVNDSTEVQTLGAVAMLYCVSMYAA